MLTQAVTNAENTVYAAKRLIGGPYRIFHGWSGECVRSLRAARAKGVRSLIEIPTWHRHKGKTKPTRHTKSEREAAALRGWAGWKQRLLITRQQMLEEYDLADRILVLSEKAEETFLHAGVPREKLFRHHRGVNVERFTPAPAPPESDEAFRERMEWDWQGASSLEGTYPFTIERSVKGFRINHFLHSLTDPEVRQAFRDDEDACLAAADLSDEERDLIRKRDWIGMIRYGVIFFMLEKLGAVTGVGNIHIYAAMKGMSVEDFQKTRNAAITYGVGGKEK